MDVAGDTILFRGRYMEHSMRTRLPVICLTQICLVFLIGCGTFGKTSVFVVHVDPSVISGAKHRIQIGRVLVASDANVLVAAGTMFVGKFDEEDRLKFASSLQKSLDGLKYPATVAASPPWTIDVVLRKHILGHDNVSAGLVTCIAWRLTSDDGQVVFEDEFYGASSARVVGTIGGVKNAVNRAVAKRLIESALLVGSGMSIEPVTVDRTFETFSEATSQVPDNYQSLPIIVVNHSSASIFGAGFSSDNVLIVQPQDPSPKSIHWSELEPKGPVLWP